ACRFPAGRSRALARQSTDYHASTRGDPPMSTRTLHYLAGAAALAATLATAPLAHAETFKVGIVSFLSGQAADSCGIPAVNGAKFLIGEFNAGTAPAPSDKKGFGGLTIEPIYVDEAGG